MKVCIICQKPVKNGMRIKEDVAIRTIRQIKQRFGIAKNNELYICEEDASAHRERRRGFERNLVIAAVIGALLILLLMALPLLAGRFDPIGLISALGIGVLMVLAVVFFRYTPDVEARDSPKTQRRK